MIIIIYHDKYRINTDFIKKVDPLTFLNKIKKGEITEEAEESQKGVNKHLIMIRKRNKNEEREKNPKQS